ncbi:MAG TPA: phosphatidylserine/phosphatidylglycerophosphate/cardiolipin synthase family protein [Myxococcota bacterium]|nr:phosphatidylserine/phosphatidylglycerophosphate/cardiolipin synthase family protein [Myxococcota bacterium]
MERHGDYLPFVSSGSYPIRGGNAVRPLVDGGPAFARICEAIENARKSVWVTVAFHRMEFAMPDGHGSLFDVLDRAQARGLDVRALFWRHPQLEQISPGSHFAGTEADREFLRRRGSRFLARWDRAHGRYCQHQKSWLVDAGQASEIAFVGGINLHNSSVVAPGHAPRAGGSTHDVYVEVRGPSASDVHHNFVQRWNEASDRELGDGLWPDASSQSLLEFPRVLSRTAGAVPVQIQRTVRRERYFDGTPAVDHTPFAIGGGEHSILDQYLRVIDRARRAIYIEDQAIGAPQIVDALRDALGRGVEVVVLVPADPNDEMAAGRADPENAAFFESLAALGRFDHFALAGIASCLGRGEYQNVYVHAKIALVDDAWCTIGSANIGNRSFFGDTELNASFWHTPTVRALRCELLREHLGRDTAQLDERAALRLYREVARKNAAKRAAGEPMEGLAFALDPATYAS